MFYSLVYGLSGLYLLLMSLHLIHKQFMANWQGSRLTALRIAAIGLLILSFYYAWFTWFMSTDEGKAHQELQQKMQRQYTEEHR